MRISDWSSDVCSSDLAVNCIARTPLSCLWGTNTDIAGVAWALRGAKLDGAIICLIGSGGAARSVLCRLYNEPIAALRILARDVRKRSEEHTSELQSLMRIPYAVFCLKKKNTESKHT